MQYAESSGYANMLQIGGGNDTLRTNAVNSAQMS